VLKQKRPHLKIKRVGILKLLQQIVQMKKTHRRKFFNEKDTQNMMFKDTVSKE
jgi:hypothetical protein